MNTETAVAKLEVLTLAACLSAHRSHRPGNEETHDRFMVRRNALLEAYAVVTGESLESVSERFYDMTMSALGA